MTFAFPYQFSTKRLEVGSGLYDFGARWYDPSIGRFLSPDPAGFVDGTNLYAYVANNPVNFIDPFGLSKANSRIRDVLSVVQRGLAGALSVLGRPVELLRTDVFTFYDANRGVFIQLERHAYEVIRPFQNVKSGVQGVGLLLGGLNVAVDPIALVAAGRLDVPQGQAVVSVRSFETIINAAAAAGGATAGTYVAGLPGAVIGAVGVGTGTAWVTRRIGNWILESIEVAVR